MAHDLVIRNGVVIDGTGGPERRVDIGVDGDTITAIGEVGPGHREIDATGCIVTPGFIDPHTHLDTQLCWDPTGAPSNVHGVTTVIMGMCGFGIAPCPDGGGEYLLRSLEVVEEIPYASTSLGVTFSWTTWPEFLDHLEAQRPTINVGGMVPHSSLRYYVMGDRARQGAATPDERQALAAELRRSLDGGALGFASSRGPNHLDAFGEPVPSRHANDDELRALVLECRDRPWQINIEAKMSMTAEPMLAEVDRYAAWTEEAGARLTWTPFVSEPSAAVAQSVLDHHVRLNEHVVVRPQVIAQAITTTVSFGRTNAPAIAGWEPAGLAGLDHAARLERLADPDVRAALRAAGSTGRGIRALYDVWVILDSPTRPDLLGSTVGAAADATGVHPVDLLLDLMIADDLATEIQAPALNADPAAAAAITADPLTLTGLGDAGAHVRSITNFAYTTEMLARLVRDEQRFTLPWAVQRMTSEPAHFFGITDRGELRIGAKADVCVIDLDRLAVGPIDVRTDLPGGAARLWRGATGYRAIVVNGEITVADDELTDARPGQAVRG